jgi:hypothetical protein
MCAKAQLALLYRLPGMPAWSSDRSLVCVAGRYANGRFKVFGLGLIYSLNGETRGPTCQLKLSTLWCSARSGWIRAAVV